MKLFHKTLYVYLTYSIIVFVISVPVFYLLVQHLWIEDVDDSLLFQKEKIINGISSFRTDSATIMQFSETAMAFDLGIYVVPLKNQPPDYDSIYNNSFYDKTRMHVEPFRELKSIVNVNGISYKIIVRKDLVESIDLIRGIILTQAMLFLLLLAGNALLNNFFARKIWRPFYHLVSQLNTFRIEREEPIITEKSNINEFNDLNNSVINLTQNSIHTFRAQKEFTENAAHETQTPLAVIKSLVDLLTQDEHLTKEQAQIIERMDKNIRHMTKLNRNLLLLAKIDNAQFDIFEKINVHEILEESIEVFEEQIKLKGIRLILMLEKQPTIESSSFLFHLLVTNLIKNALKHNTKNGFIEIYLGNYFLSIANSGENSPLPENAIFNRFYRKGQQEESSGLGLAIAKRICELLKFELKYSFEKNNKHSFLVSFTKN